LRTRESAPYIPVYCHSARNFKRILCPPRGGFQNGPYHGRLRALSCAQDRLFPRSSDKEMKQRTKIWQPLVAALLAGALLSCGWEGALDAAEPAQPPVPAAAPAPSRPALTVRQGEGSPAASPDGAGLAPFIEVKDKNRISASAKNRPLDELLRIMSEKNLFEIRGPVPRGEGITVEFSNLTLEQALKKVMRGYNYVLVDQGTSRKPALIVMGQVTRGTSAEQGSSPQTPQRVINQPRAPEGSPVPPTPAVEQPGPGLQKGQPPVPAGAQAGGTPTNRPPEPVAQEPANQPQPNGPPGMNGVAPKPGEGAAQQPQQRPQQQPQQQPPTPTAPAGEGPVPTPPSSVNDTLPKGF
jgi:hypothetical protein